MTVLKGRNIYHLHYSDVREGSRGTGEVKGNIPTRLPYTILSDARNVTSSQLSDLGFRRHYAQHAANGECKIFVRPAYRSRSVCLGVFTSVRFGLSGSGW